MPLTSVIILFISFSNVSASLSDDLVMKLLFDYLAEAKGSIAWVRGLLDLSLKAISS